MRAADPPWNFILSYYLWWDKNNWSALILDELPSVGENHRKNGLVCNDLLINHIQQSLAGESGYVWSELKTGD